MINTEKLTNYLQKLSEALGQMESGFEDHGLPDFFRNYFQGSIQAIDEKLSESNRIEETFSDNSAAIFKLPVTIKNSHEIHSKNQVLPAKEIWRNSAGINARQNYYENLKLAEMDGNQAAIYEAKLTLGQFHNRQSNWIESLLLLEECQKFFTGAGQVQKTTEVFLQIGLAYLKKGEYELARVHLENVILTAQRNQCSELILASCLALGTLYLITNPNKKALSYIEEALRISHRKIDPASFVDVYFQLGSFYKRENDFQQSVKYFDLGIKFCRQHDFFSQMAPILIEKARLFFSCGQLSQAMILIDSALNIVIETENCPGIAGGCLALAEALAQNQNSMAVRNFYKLAIEIFQDYKLPFETAAACVEFADRLLEMEENELAVENYQMAFDLFEKLKLTWHFQKVSAKLLEYDSRMVATEAGQYESVLAVPDF